MPLRSALLAAALATVPALQEGVPVETRAPDVVFELQQFSARAEPPAWSGEVVNGLFGAGSMGLRERRDGWLAAPEHWRLFDVADRAGNLSTNGWLEQRGIRAEASGFNEYQETIHLHERVALPLLGERGLARGALGELVRDPVQNQDNPAWRAHSSGNAYIADPLEPRWSAILRYDVLTSPLFGDALSQDNIGGPTSRMGPGAIGRFGNAASRGFAQWLARRGGPSALPLRTYLRERLWGAFARLPPYAPEGSADASAAAQSLCADPVFAEFQIFQHAANLHAFARHYTDLRRVAARAEREFDVHGNLDGAIVGATAYPIALGELVDSLWFETSGNAEYDQVQHGWWNALGSLRLGLAQALARGRKPAYFVTGVRQLTPEMVSLELAEVSAGGGVSLLNPDILGAQARNVVLAIEGFLRMRDTERAFFAPRGRARFADVALLYSIPTFMFDPCVPTVSSTGAAPLSNLSGAARALEEGHVSYDVVVLGHADLGGDRAVFEDVAKRPVVVAPSIENLSDAQLGLLERYLRGGGTLAVLGRFGVRDERNRPRAENALERMRAAGRVVTLLGGERFPPPRAPENANTRALADRFRAELGRTLPRPIVAGDLPRTLWVKTWTHRGGRISAHFVNYGFDAERAHPLPTPPVALRLRLPPGDAPNVVRWLTPGAPARALAFELRDGVLQVVVPPVTSYGVIAIGPASPAPAGDRVASASAREREYLARIQTLASFGEPVLALAFGETVPFLPWQPVRAETAYRSALGYGWLPSDDDSQATPEESGYRGSEGVDPNALRGVSQAHPFWPFEPGALPHPLRLGIASGRRQRLRLDLPDGVYRVSVVNANGSWSQRNTAVSGMVGADGRAVLLDVPLGRGEFARRAFTTRVSGGKLELDFGGPTGFGVAALLVERADAEASDPLETGAVREWSVSARHPNPDWTELEDVIVPAPEPGTPVEARAGIPLVDLGTLSGASIGDVVVARAVIERAASGTATLSVGASSGAHVYLNGERVLVVPNVKGVERDEGIARVSLRAGRNELALVLERFWERRWMFYASVH